jgi:hypothetical protein
LASSKSSQEVTELSSLRTGEAYTIKADGVDLRLQVIQEGSTPACIVSGTIDNEKSEENAEPVLIQLIGWIFFDEDPLTQNWTELFQIDTKPHGFSILLGVWVKGKVAQPVMLGDDATIMPVS